MKTYQALLLLERTCPELFFLISKTRISISEKVPTAYATIERHGREVNFKIVIGKKFHDDLDVFSLAGLIEHELLHIVLSHLTLDHFKVIAKKNMTALNIAMDAVINDLGDIISQKDKLHPHLQGAVFMDRLRVELKDNSLSIRTHTTIDIYNLIRKHLDENKQKQMGDSAFDEHLQGDVDGMDEAMQDAIGQVLEQADIKKNMEKLIEKKAGKSSEMQQIFTELVAKRNNMSFKKAVNMFLTSNKSIETKSSWKKLSKRFPNQKGKVRTKTQKILLALDVSGSMMSEEILKKIHSVITEATKNEYNVDLIFGDTKKLGEYKNIDSKFDFAKIVGGGGTELGFIFETKFEDYDGAVILTDGYFEHEQVPVKLKSKLLFLLTENCPFLQDNFKTIGI